MDAKQRAELIRLGNQAFNAENYPEAKKYFIQADYKDGLIRLGDYYMYERRLPLLAYSYYKKAGETGKIEDLQRRMIGAIGEWIGKDKIKPESRAVLENKAASYSTDQEGMVEVPVSSELRDMARKILAEKS